MYADLAALRAYLGLTAEQTTDDALLTSLLNRGQAVIDAVTGRTFEAAADATKTFDAERDVSADRRTLYIDNVDLCQITSITNGDGVAVSASAYVTEPRLTPPFHALTMKRNSDVVWTWDETPEGAISIVGRWAWSVTAPLDIQHALVRLAAYLYRQKDSGQAGNESTVIAPGGMVVVPSSLPKDVMTLLDRYRRRV